MRIYVTNRLKEPTTIHWHGLILPSGMDGVGGLSQPQIGPGETFAYEFDLVRARPSDANPAGLAIARVSVGRPPKPAPSTAPDQNS